MLSTVITILLVSVMLSITGKLIVSAIRAHRRRVPVASPVQAATTLPVFFGTTSNVQLQQTQPHAYSLPTSWYRRHKTLVSTSLLIMIVLTLFLQSGLADGALQQLGQGLSAFNLSQHTAGLDLTTSLPPISFSASERVVRIDSAARDQYYSDYQWQVWSYSSCSGISMEMVINAYGHHYIAADFLQKELSLGVWDITLGLTGGEPGMAEAAAYFGFKALPNPPRTLQALLATANKGYPVIVGSSGHIMVVKGGNATSVFIADSSPANRTIMSYASFMSWWNGFSVVLVPR